MILNSAVQMIAYRVFWIYVGAVSCNFIIFVTFVFRTISIGFKDHVTQYCYLIF